LRKRAHHSEPKFHRRQCPALAGQRAMWPAIEYGDRAVETASELREGVPTALLPMPMLDLNAMTPCAQPVVVLSPSTGGWSRRRQEDRPPWNGSPRPSASRDLGLHAGKRAGAGLSTGLNRGQRARPVSLLCASSRACRSRLDSVVSRQCPRWPVGYSTTLNRTVYRPGA
jgi:hypothetical protein